MKHKHDWDMDLCLCDTMSGSIRIPSASTLKARRVKVSGGVCRGKYGIIGIIGIIEEEESGLVRTTARGYV